MEENAIDDNIQITFDSTDRESWLRVIDYAYCQLSKSEKLRVSLDFSTSVLRDSLEPFHLVTIACLIQHFYQLGKMVTILKSNKEVCDFIYEELKYHQYWSGGKNHVEAKTSQNVLNLWRIVENEKDLYAHRVEEYLRKTYLKNKDLSAIFVCLVEAYYNVFDHAKAEGNAFSFIQYDQQTGLLHVAVSDFGIGIAKAVRDFDSTIVTDKDAILKALENNFTTRSTQRNRGFGLDNILSPTEEARIFSHHGLVYKTGGVFYGYETDFSYPGTLIYFEVNLSNMDEEQLIEEFSF